MIDLSQITGFDWDEGNSRKSLEKHSVTQIEAEQVFVDEHLILALDVAHSRDEERFHAFGMTARGRQLQLSFTIRGHGTLIRVVSARDMSGKEKRRYAQEGKDDSEVQE
jgi:uncharacterized DUF497 family protein